MDETGFLDCNSAALEMFGYSAEAPMLHPADISPPTQPDGTPSRTAADQRIAAAFLHGKERFECLHPRRNWDSVREQSLRRFARLVCPDFSDHG